MKFVSLQRELDMKSLALLRLNYKLTHRLLNKGLNQIIFCNPLSYTGYVGGYVKRTGDKNDGCATMWKKDKFRLLRSTPVNYCRGGLLDRDNIAIVVELQPIRSGIDLQVSYAFSHVQVLYEIFKDGKKCGGTSL